MTAADRPSVTDNALAEAWAEGHRTGWEHCQDGNYGNDHWDDPTPNPYAAADRPSVTDNARAEAWRRFPDGIDVETGEPVDDYGYPATAREAFIGGAEWAAGRAETTTGAIARGEALAAGDPNWMNVTRWPQDATTTPATEDAARALDDVIQHLRKIWSTGHDEARKVIDTAEELLAQALPRLLATARTHPTEGEATATDEDAARVRAQIAVLLTQHAQSVLAREGMFDSDETSEAVDAILALLVTARTRPTRDDLILALAQADGQAWPDGMDDHTANYMYGKQADAVLALYADQPTEAEAGARALEDAADEFEAIEQRYAIVHSPVAWLRERADRTRDGAR